MTEPLGVTPAGIQVATEHLAEVNSRMAGVLSTLRGKLDGEGAAWGEDSIRHSFANGPNGCRAQVGLGKGSVDAKTGLLDDYSASLRTAADTSKVRTRRRRHGRRTCTDGVGDLGHD
jgi:hypothetical protein